MHPKNENKSSKTQQEVTHTFFVWLWSDCVELAKASFVILPLKILLTELMKLDLPVPTGPYSKTLMASTFSFWGWKSFKYCNCFSFCLFRYENQVYNWSCFCTTINVWLLISFVRLYWIFRITYQFLKKHLNSPLCNHN